MVPRGSSELHTIPHEPWVELVGRIPGVGLPARYPSFTVLFSAALNAACPPERPLQLARHPDLLASELLTHSRVLDRLMLMSKRLQVLLDETELCEIQRIARARRMTVAEWVRQALRSARHDEPTGGVDKKLASVRAALRHSFPSGDIGQMLAEIERGYGEPSRR